MNFVNYTSHPVIFVSENGTRTFPRASHMVRMDRVFGPMEWVDGVAITPIEHEIVKFLPDPKPDTLYIVSPQVANALPRRKDLIFPSRLVKDNTGRIIGCCEFLRNG
jgi:hypothetical protein